MFSFGFLKLWKFWNWEVVCLVLELRQSQKQLCSGMFEFVDFCDFLDVSPCKMCLKTTTKGRSLGVVPYIFIVLCCIIVLCITSCC